MHIYYIFITILLVAVSFESEAAYIVFDKNDPYHPVKKQDLEGALEIINSYAYPQVLIHPEKLKEIYTKRSKNESQEENFIRWRLQEKYDYLDIMFLPDTIYEMFIINEHAVANLGLRIQEEIFPQLNVAGSLYDQLFKDVDYRCANREPCITQQLNIFDSYNNIPLIKSIIFTVNNNILTIFNKLNIDPSHSLSENNVNLKIIFKMLFNSINTDYNISVLSNISTEYPQLNEKNAIIFDKLIIKNWATNFQQLVEGLRMGNMEKLEGFMRLVPFAEFTVVLNRYKDYFDPKNKDERDIIADINKRIKLLNNYSSELKKANLTLGREEKFDKSAALVNFKKFKELRDAQGNDFLSSLAVALNDASEKIELKVDRALRNHQVKMREIRKFFPEFSFTILLELTNSQLRAHLKDEMLLFRGSSGIRYKYPNDQDKAAVGTPDSPFFASKKPFAALKREAVLRGIEPRAPDEWQDYSISLGNSLFAGAYADIGACAWSYILDAPYGYSLSIKKYDNNILAYIFIAPTHPLVAFFGKGEFFHSRTKIARNAMNAVGLSPLGGGTPELILVESDENASEIGFALRSYYLKHMKIVTYKEGQDEPQLFNYKSKLAPKLIKNFEAQLTREFDVLFFREHVAKYKAVIDRINNQKLSPNQPDLNSP